MFNGQEPARQTEIAVLSHLSAENLIEVIRVLILANNISVAKH